MSSQISSLDIGLCRIDIADMDRAVSEIRKMRSENNKGYVITPNIDHLARLAEKKHSERLKEIYFDASLSLCDSRILDLILKVHGRRLPGVVTGSDLTAKLFESEISEKDRVFILGGDLEILQKIRNKYQKIKIEHHNPTMGFISKTDEVETVVAKIIAYKPNYVFLAVGSPQQEIVASKLVLQNDFNGIAMCIGASILFLAGAEKRAPYWMQKLRLEWLYRLIQNPSRLAKRYLKNATRLPVINRQISTSLRRASA